MILTRHQARLGPRWALYDGSYALGPAIRLAAAGALADVPVQLEIKRAGQVCFVRARRRLEAVTR